MIYNLYDQTDDGLKRIASFEAKSGTHAIELGRKSLRWPIVEPIFDSGSKRREYLANREKGLNHWRALMALSGGKNG